MLHRVHPRGPRPCGPRGSFLSGNLQAYEEDRLGFLLRTRDEYGGIVAFDSRTTVINDATVADQILRDASGAFETNQNFLGHRLAQGDIASILDARSLLNPGLRPTALSSIPADVSALVRERVAGADDMTLDAMTLAEQVIPHAFAMRIFGHGSATYVAETAGLLDVLEQVIGNVFAVPASWRSPTQRRIEALHANLRDRLCRDLTARSALSVQTECIAGAEPIANLLARHTERHGLERLADLLIGAMLAAQRVPAAGAAWLLLLLADRPGTQIMLRSEAATFRQSVNAGLTRPITDYPLTLSVVLESLRLFPPTWLITRTATRNVQVANYAFSAGHTFMISPYVVHRDPTLYERPEEFRPERWQSQPPPPMTFLAFGRGRHRCPGADLTTSSLVALVLTLLDEYEISRSGSVTADPRTTLKPSGLRVRLDGVANQRPTGTCPAAASAF